jgi:hypothetical protein
VTITLVFVSRPPSLAFDFFMAALRPRSKHMLMIYAENIKSLTGGMVLGGISGIVQDLVIIFSVEMKLGDLKRRGD